MASKLYNLSHLQEISGGKKEFEKDIIETFLKQYPKIIEKMREFFNDKNWDQLSEIAHKFKSTATLLGINKIYEKDLELEKEAKKKNNLDDILSLIDSIKELSKEAGEQLKLKLENY
ncbi:MAG: Hpt domain-containing protein [Bacteroidota bacterium]|nr:Hpt domain-containing protein [Bacteroidota bacterium]